MDYHVISQSPALWMFAFAIMAVICFQAVLFFKLVRDNARNGYATPNELRTAMRAGAISAIGPSFAVTIVALSLIPVFGTPVVLMRIGMVGSVPYELASANAAANSMGTPLGSESFDARSFATVLLVMVFGVGIWMIQIILFTSSMGKFSARIENWRPWATTGLTSGALLGTFGNLTITQSAGGRENMIVMLSAAGCMLALGGLAQWKQINWLKEWALGLSMLFALVVASFTAV